MPSKVNPPDLRQTMLVVKHNGTQVGEVPATAPHAEAYIAGLSIFYGGVEIERVENPDAGLLALFSAPVPPPTHYPR